MDKPAAGIITATDEAGNEILSYVPLALEADFLSRAGQSIVSRPGSLCTFSVLTNTQTLGHTSDDIRPFISYQPSPGQRLRDLQPRIRAALVRLKIRQRVHRDVSGAHRGAHDLEGEKVPFPPSDPLPRRVQKQAGPLLKPGTHQGEYFLLLGVHHIAY